MGVLYFGILMFASLAVFELVYKKTTGKDLK